MTYPITQTHADVPKDVLEKNGITERTLRMSVGIENVGDLIADLEEAFMAEKNLNFEQVIERRGTDCLKYDFASKRGLPEGVLPLWVADMDFRISSYIQEDLFEQVKHGIYGYTDTLDEYYQAVNKWLDNQYGYNVLEEEIVKTSGVVYAIGMAIEAFTRQVMPY